MAAPAPVEKVCACVLRATDSGNELLVFDHPTAGVQLPKGGLRQGETAERGVLRELQEETGVVDAVVTARLGVWEPDVSAAQPTRERQRWHIFSLRARHDLPEAWDHPAVGSVQEAGLVFRCRWVPLDAHTADRLHPLFGPVIGMLLDARGQSSDVADEG